MRLLLHCCCVAIFISAMEAHADQYSECITRCANELAACKEANDRRLSEARQTYNRCKSDANTVRDREVTRCRRDYRNNPARQNECIAAADSTHSRDIDACDSAMRTANEQHRIDSQGCDAAHDGCIGTTVTGADGTTTATGCQKLRCRCDSHNGSIVEDELGLELAGSSEECTCEDGATDDSADAIIFEY